MNFFQQMIAALPAVATSWQAVAGYVALTVAFVVVSLKVTRNKNLLNKIKSLPEKDRARVLQMEMGASYLATGLSPEQWLQQQRQRYYFVGFLAVCGLTVALVLAAMLSGGGGGGDSVAAQHRAETVAQELLAKLNAHDFKAAYELFPDDVRKNIGFAQFKADIDRMRFQLPGEPLKDSIEQSVANGAFLSVFVTSEFSVETRVRNVVGFAKDGNGWKLWQYNWQPVDWPLVWPSSTEARLSAADAIKAYRSLSEKDRAVPLPKPFRGNITGSAPGWKLVVNSVSRGEDDHRCTVDATEADSSITVELKNVVGGCKLQEGSRVLVNALISGISNSGIQLEGVRYFTES